MDYAKPHLTEMRELEKAKLLLNPDVGESGKNKFIMKTVQAWVNDISYDWEHDLNHTLVYPELQKLTKRLELASQFKISHKTASTEYQVTHYGLGGLCETHIDPYGYLEGAKLYDYEPVQRLKQTGDMLGTFMGYLNHVEAGGATAFSKPFKEEIIKPEKGSITFWYSLDSKGHRLSGNIC